MSKDTKAGGPLDVSSCTDNQKVLILQYAADVRKFEIERFWARSLFFWGFITTALAAYGAAKDLPVFQTAAGCYGLLCSLAWTLQNRGGKYWHESWEIKVEQVEREVLGANLFSNKEPLKHPEKWFAAKRYSSSRLTMILSDATCAAWAALLLIPLKIDPSNPFDASKVLMLLATAIFSYLLISHGRSRG